MASFFEKLKKGMGIESEGETEEPSSVKLASTKSVIKIEKTKKEMVKKPKLIEEEYELTEIKTEKIKLPKIKKKIIKEEPIGEEEPTEEATEEEEFVQEKPKPKKKFVQQEEIKKITSAEIKPTMTKIKTEKIEDKEKWLKEPVGQLAIDVYQTEFDLVIQSAIAGVKSEELDITLENDRIIIKGVRHNPSEENCDYFTQECYFGPFSREIILPVEVHLHQVEAEMKEGILTIRMPKIIKERIKKIIVKKGG